MKFNTLRKVHKIHTYTLMQWFSAGGGLFLRGIWQCLQTCWVVTTEWERRCSWDLLWGGQGGCCSTSQSAPSWPHSTHNKRIIEGSRLRDPALMDKLWRGYSCILPRSRNWTLLVPTAHQKSPDPLPSSLEVILSRYLFLPFVLNNFIQISFFKCLLIYIFTQ